LTVRAHTYGPRLEVLQATRAE